MQSIQSRCSLKLYIYAYTLSHIRILTARDWFLLLLPPCSRKKIYLKSIKELISTLLKINCSFFNNLEILAYKEITTRRCRVWRAYFVLYPDFIKSTTISKSAILFSFSVLMSENIFQNALNESFESIFTN